MSPVAPAPSADLLIDLSDRTKLRLSGADRVRFLNGQVSNDVRQIQDDRSIYTCVMTIKGKMCGDAYVHAGQDFLLLDAEPELRETLAARLERYIIADDVVLEDVTDGFSLLHLLVAPDRGPAAIDFIGTDEIAGNPTQAGQVQAVQADRFGTMGIDLFVPAELAPNYRTQLARQFRTASDTEIESLRVRAGIPRWGAELTEDTMPAEAGLEERAVSYAKGCYIGQEVVSRVKSVGHVNWQLRGLRAVDPGVLLAPGQLLRAPGQPNDRSLGRITSVSPAPASNLALAYVRRGSEAPGTRLDLYSTENGPGASLGQIEVCSLPFSLP